MKAVSIDLTPALHQPAGVGRYTQQLVRALIDLGVDLNYFYAAPEAGGLPALPPRPTAHLKKTARAFRALAAQSHLLRQPQDALLPPGALFHATDHTLPFLKRASVITLYDITPQTHPQFHQPLNRWYTRLFLPVYLRQAQVILSISQHTRAAVERWLPWTAEKIVVTPLGVDARFQPQTDPARRAQLRAVYDLPAEFILAVGTLEPRKNLVTLLEAYAALLKQRPMPTLVLTGKTGWRNQNLAQRLRDLNLEDQVRLTGYVPDDDLPSLLAAATVFVYPSLSEGFGLPPLEALACGVPVLCSNTSALPEVVGQAALLFDPLAPGDLAAALNRLLDQPELRADLSERGLRQAALFTWRRTAQLTQAVYERVLRSPVTL